MNKRILRYSFVFLLIYSFITSVFFLNTVFKKKTTPIHKISKRIKIDKNTEIIKSTFVDKKKFNDDLKQIKKENFNLKKMVEILKKNRSRIKTITKIKTRIINKYIKVKQKSDFVKKSYYEKDIKTKDSFLLAKVGFDISNLKRPWSYKLEPLKLKILILTSKKKGYPDQISFSAYLINSKQKKHKIEILDAETKVLYKEKEKKLKVFIVPFRLSLDGIVGYSFKEKKPKIGFGLSSSLIKLGYDKDTIATFVKIGVSLVDSNNIGITVAPFSYNLGYNLPVINDLFISGGIGFYYNLVTNSFDNILFLSIGTQL